MIPLLLRARPLLASRSGALFPSYRSLFTSSSPLLNGEEALPEPTQPLKDSSSPRVAALVDQITSLSLIEVSQLTKALQVKLGLPDPGMMPMAMGIAPTSGGAAESAAPAAPAKTSFSVKLNKFDAAVKIKLIKEVRTLMPSLGLKEAKELVEKAPVVLKEDLPKEEADKFLEKLKEVGADVALE